MTIKIKPKLHVKYSLNKHPNLHPAVSLFSLYLSWETGKLDINNVPELQLASMRTSEGEG